MTKIIGYLEGTNAVWLSTLSLKGYDVLPLSNGYDGHGLNIQMIHLTRKPGLVIGYLHKLLPSAPYETTIEELLYRTKIFNIPVIVVCPKEFHERAKQVVHDLPENAMLVDPDDVLEKALELLEQD